MGEPNSSSHPPPAAHNRGDAWNSRVASPQSQPTSPPPLRSRWEFRPSSEYSMSTEDRALTGRPQDASLTEEYSEGRWLKWDSEELRRRREMTTQQTPPLQQRPDNSAEPLRADATRTSRAWFGDRLSAFDLFASSLSSSTEDRPSQRSVEEPSPPEKAPDKGNLVPARSPRTAMPRSHAIGGNVEPAGKRQQQEAVHHGTEESHLPYWTAHAKCSGTVPECPLKHDPMPAQLQVFDTETAREESDSHGSGAAVVGEGLETGGEISTAKGTGGERGAPSSGDYDLTAFRRFLASRDVYASLSAKRLQSELPTNEKPRDGGTDHKEAGAVPKAEDQLRSCYINELEYHHYVTAVLQRIPMRLLLFDMALAFLFVIFSHMRILGLRESARLKNATPEFPGFRLQAARVPRYRVRLRRSQPLLHAKRVGGRVPQHLRHGLSPVGARAAVQIPSTGFSSEASDLSRPTCCAKSATSWKPS
ncbi:hypothetical protein MTO96_031779 [Rhipicephalus appendiculatus]